MIVKKCLKCGRLKAVSRENFYYKRKADSTFRDTCIDCHHGGPNMTDWLVDVDPEGIRHTKQPSAKERKNRQDRSRKLIKLIRKNYKLWKAGMMPQHNDNKWEPLDYDAIYDWVGKKPRLRMHIDFITFYDIDEDWDKLVDPENFRWKKIV